MEACANCGHELDAAARFCPSCGRPVDHEPPVDRTAEHPVTPAAPPPPAMPPPPGMQQPSAMQQPPAIQRSPAVPPPVVEPPPQARYPLFADGSPEPAPAAQAPQVAPAVEPLQPAPPVATPPRPGRRSSRHARRSRGGWLTWAIGGTTLLLVALIGALLLIGDDDDGVDPSARDASPATSAPPSPTPTDPTPAPTPTTQEPPASAGPTDLARYAAVAVPDTAPPNEDVSGNLVRYEARHLVDGVPETCWRMPGSGEGQEIVFTFQAPVVLSEVGLVNGYAKTSGDLDWYRGNRRVLDVEWVFDDGTVVEQALDETREPQVRPIEPVTTTTVTLRLLDVSEPGSGRSARDYTAISDVSLVGEPA
jgi:hypothetical protein